MTVNVKLFDSLADVAADAGDALDRANQPCLFQRFEWFAATAEHCSEGHTPIIARARDGDAAAWLFLFKTGRRHAEALTSWYSLAYDIVRHGENDALTAELAASLADMASLSLGPIADPERIERAFRSNGWKVYRSIATQKWELATPPSFDDYWAARPGKLRSTVKRKGKKANLDIKIHRSFDDQAWQDYREIYAHSWKPEEGSWDFMKAFAEREGNAGTLRLGVAYQDGQAVAAQLWTVENGRATIHKLAYREDAKSFSPGSILGAAMFREIIEQDHPKIIDYGTGDQPYKADWMDGRQPLYTLTLYNPRRPEAWLPLAKQWISGLVRRAPSD
ncbi:GNAT family N-acetyltransferase [Parasphingopyxis sp. CP4]|uniref:GNAT family N-acetyltransferase n=1 Tax=Parasphingopyxis sp. CP4 TaxID=2724527 RepID=UPI0015A26CCC|nr:GNAT family N-acetyltransferase [Parasphingopyxis sp. CP4]QLC21408.1 GNAT family N-acetyltransferase [Parasphingopyxis sp. CP4]